MDKFQQIKTLLTEMDADAVKFYLHQNMAAGNRLRVKLNELRNLAQSISFEIGGIIN